MNLLNLIFKNRPSQSLEFLSRIGVGFDHPNDSELGLRSYLERLAYAAGVNHIVQVNDCEDNGGYTESDNGVFDLETFAATGKRVGTNCLLMTETAACDNSQYIQTTYINESKPVPVYFGKRQMDWRDTRYLGFWIHNAADTGAFGTTGELQVAIVSGGVVQTKVQITGLTDAVHQWVEIDMTSSDVDWDLSKVESLRFYCNNANTG